jgi:hypothetical protein
LQQVSKSSFADMEIIVAKNEISNDNCLRWVGRQQNSEPGQPWNQGTSLKQEPVCSLRKIEGRITVAITGGKPDR